MGKDVITEAEFHELLAKLHALETQEPQGAKRESLDVVCVTTFGSLSFYVPIPPASIVISIGQGNLQLRPP